MRGKEEGVYAWCVCVCVCVVRTHTCLQGWGVHLRRGAPLFSPKGQQQPEGPTLQVSLPAALLPQQL